MAVMSAATEPEDDDADDPGSLSYTYKPSLLGAPCHFLLRRDGLQWHMASFQGFIPYRDVRRVRLSYRPASMQAQRFLMEIWSAANPKIRIASASWRNFLDLERLDTGYAAFVTELHRRLAAVGSAAHFSTGMPVVSYWIGVLVFGAAILALVLLTLRALRVGEWAAAAIIGVLCVVFAAQLGTYFLRNRPGRYRPEAVPPSVLPRVKS
jgi:hypothetical protein